MALFSDQRKLDAARKVIEHLGGLLDARFSVRLWDASMVPLGKDVDPEFFIAINSSAVVGILLRRPTYENLLRQYVNGSIDIHGDLIDFVAAARDEGSRSIKKRLRDINKSLILKQSLPFLFSSRRDPNREHQYRGDEVGRKESRRNNQAFIQFHYDISNEFYALFLGQEMQYSCGYFKTPETSLDQAQHDKLEMICRKLRLQPGDRFLDIGCGWGGLICHAAQHYDVQAHGVTLSQTQFDYTTEKVKRLGLESQIRVELRDYETLEGEYDKIASIGMFEHVGIANMTRYFRKIKSLLRDRGILLNHGICRVAKRTRRVARKIRPERRLLLKYIFPGSELDQVGHTIDLLQVCRFEVHDVEAWRGHYALTARHWYRGLMANKARATEMVGKEKFRMWALYLAGASIGFADGSAHICQVVASRRSSKGASGLPLTRADLYRPSKPSQEMSTTG